MKIWKLLGLAALVTAAATVLLTTTTASAGGKESQTLVWWHNVTQGPGVKLYKDIAAEFQKQHPGITIKAVPLQNEQFKTKIPIALQSDSPPDVFQSWGGGGLVDQQKAGKVADLTKYVKPWIKSIGGTAAGWQVNGKQYAVPYSVGVVGFWYNKQLFKQAGLASAPKTWPQFLSAVAKLKQAGITPIAIGSKDEWPDAFYWDYLATKLCSKPVMQSSAVTYNFGNSCWTKAGEYLQQLLDAGPFQNGFLATPAQQGASSSAGLGRERQGGDGAPGALEPRGDAVTDPGEQGPELPRLVPVPERAGQQGDPRLAPRRRGRLRVLLEGSAAGVRTVPRVHRQPERPAARRVDGLRAAGPQGDGELRQGSEPAHRAEVPLDLAVHPALPRSGLFGGDRAGAERGDRQAVRR